jgi:hypothetical protein
MVQYATRIGIKVITVRIKVSLKPPPIVHARIAGSKRTAERSWVFEKVSEPPPSAGRGELWIAGNL